MKRIIYLLVIALLSFSLISCKETEPVEPSKPVDPTQPTQPVNPTEPIELTDFQSFVQAIYQSEEVLKSYVEISSIKSDDDFLAYEKKIEYSIDRQAVINTRVKTTIKELSNSGDEMYQISSSEYWTEGETKYQEVSGSIQSSKFQIPTYFLTFVLAEAYLEAGYEFTRNNNDYTLKGTIIDNEIASFFLNKSVNTVSNLEITISVTNGKLMSMTANYLSTNGFKVEIAVSYQY